jgi:hypothetical protein
MSATEIVVAILGALGGTGGIIQLIIAINKIRQGQIKEQKDRQFDMKSQRDDALARANLLQDELDAMHRLVNDERTKVAKLEGQLLRAGIQPVTNPTANLPVTTPTAPQSVQNSTELSERGKF